MNLSIGNELMTLLKFSLYCRVGKTWLPYHDHGETWLWACHEDDMAACFLAWSSWFKTWSWYDYHVLLSKAHTMIMVWSSCFPRFFGKMDCLSMFSQRVGAIYHYMAHMTGLREDYASRLPSQQNWSKIIPEIEFPFVLTRQQVLK